MTTVCLTCLTCLTCHAVAQLSQYQPGLSEGRGQSQGDNRQGQGNRARPSPGGPSTAGRGGGSGGGGGGGGGRGGGGGGGSDHQGLDWLRESVPGEPGVDYPVYSLPVPDNAFRSDSSHLDFSSSFHPWKHQSDKTVVFIRGSFSFIPCQ